MRHGAKINHLGRKTPHRKALLRNLACQLIQHKRIVTTLAKAKALRVFVEPLITKSKNDTTHQRRVVFSYLQNKEAIKELFSTVNTKVGDRPGGYTRIIKLDRRIGDAADMAMIELVDFNEIYNPKQTVGEEKKKTRRSRTAKKATPKAVPAAAPVAEAPAAEVVEAETPVVETPVVETTAAEVAETPAVEAVAEAAAAEVVEAETPVVETPVVETTVAEVAETPAVEAVAEAATEETPTPAEEPKAEGDTTEESQA